MIVFTEAQCATLRALADSFIPAVPGHEAAAYWQRRGSDGVDLDKMAQVLAAQPQSNQQEFRQLLGLLDSPVLGLTWFGPLQPFGKLTPAQREHLLQSWAQSRVGHLRKAFHSLRKLLLFLYYGDANAAGGNPAWAAIGYPGPQEKAVDTPKPLQLLHPTDAVTYECDVLVIGSGAGGGVVAGELAAAGHAVLVLEKGPYYHGGDFTQREADMMGTLYDAKGGLSTQDGGVALLAGSCLGGGTTVNWAGAFRTPDYVLAEWAQEHQVPHFTSDAFGQSLDAVSQAIGVNTDYRRHNAQNQVLQAGSQALGQETKLIPRNEKGLDPGSEAHFRSLGFSPLGDQHGIKQGTLNTYLQQAFDHGARLLADTYVTRITTDHGRATGAEAVYTAPNGQAVLVRVRARRVVVAGGAIQTPALLLRSGLQHPHLGQHLHLHPTVVVAGGYAQRIDPWFGPMMSVVNDTYTRLNGTNFGVKLETPPAHVGLMATVLPWQSGEQHKALMQQAAHLGSFIVLTRDRDGGRVGLDRQGTPRIHYVLSDFDRAHLLTGVRAAVGIHAAAGAHTIYLPHGTLPTLRVQEGQLQNPAVLESLAGLGWKPNQFGLYSAHQMSTCRMGGNRATHPVGPTGETYEVRGLFVADASAFPACSGVNPMLTVMALAHYTAQQLKAELVR